ncbi:MAG: sulfite exporter TauE/SafE family protein [Rubrivivax sp.]|jgi:hypothetical protein|nr:sulfite exporter TauE/SafE family protein [Rubrivivax sp.]
MLDLALLGSLLALGLAGTPHCAAMCAAPCALAAGNGRAPQTGFHVARLVSYGALGAVAAASVGALAQWAPQLAALRPVWVLLHAAALALGLWWLLRGRTYAAATRPWLSSTAVALPAGGSLRDWRGVGRGVASGTLWAAWPCGLLHGALAVAALASTPASGALLMGAFAAVTSPALIAGPWALRRLGERGRAGAMRLAGGLLVLASAWALGHGLWHDYLAWCATRP